MKLAEQKCRPIQPGAAPLGSTEAEALVLEIPAWTLAEKELRREFRFRDFREAVRFTNDVAEIANAQDHHPDIFISYNKVKLTFSTHKVNGLSMNDFIMAAKVDLLAEGQRGEKAA